MRDMDQDPDLHGTPVRDLTIRVADGPDIKARDAMILHVETGRGTGQYITKDSGKRETYSTGMVRDVQDGKARHDLLWPLGVPYSEQFMTRVAQLLARGAEKYGERNWEKAETAEELERFRASAARHFAQWISGEQDEDHAAGVAFNLLAFETTFYRLNQAEDAA